MFSTTYLEIDASTQLFRDSSALIQTHLRSLLRTRVNNFACGIVREEGDFLLVVVNQSILVW